MTAPPPDWFTAALAAPATDGTVNVDGAARAAVNQSGGGAVMAAPRAL